MEIFTILFFYIVNIYYIFIVNIYYIFTFFQQFYLTNLKFIFASMVGKPTTQLSVIYVKIYHSLSL
jgi:hypothetical protein